VHDHNSCVVAGQKREARLHARTPAIHVLTAWSVKDVDARDKPGHDESGHQERACRAKQKPHRNEACDQNAAKSYCQAPRLRFDCCLQVIHRSHQVGCRHQPIGFRSQQVRPRSHFSHVPIDQ
jgi:hypothetical protein